MCTCVRMCERTYMRVIYIYSKNFVFLIFFLYLCREWMLLRK